MTRQATTARSRLLPLLVFLCWPPGWLPGQIDHAMAQPQPDQPLIAVLPLAANDERMNLYGTPIANAVTEQLRAQGGFRVEALSLSGMLPARVDLVVDGRIVSSPSGEIHLEARVRDPEQGTTVASVATGERALAEVDRLTADLAAALVPRLRAAVTTGDRAGSLSGPATLRGPGQAAAQTPGQTANQTPGQRPDTLPDRQPTQQAHQPSGQTPGPALVVFGAAGQAADGVIPVEDVATRAGHTLARTLGFRPAPAREHGIVAPDTAIAELRRAGAAYGLMLQVHDVTFSWRGVLTARAHVRAILVDVTGRAIYDRSHHTDTVVGNRGDRHAALVRYAMSQTIDILAPEMARTLAARARKSEPQAHP